MTEETVKKDEESKRIHKIDLSNGAMIIGMIVNENGKKINVKCPIYLNGNGMAPIPLFDYSQQKGICINKQQIVWKYDVTDALGDVYFKQIDGIEKLKPKAAIAEDPRNKAARDSIIIPKVGLTGKVPTI